MRTNPLRRQAVDIKKRRPLSIQMRQRLLEGLFLISIMCAVFLLVSLFSYHITDPGWSSTGVDPKVANWGGRVGAFVADVFLLLFGYVAYLSPFLLVLSSWLGLRVQENNVPKSKSREWLFKILGWVLLIASSAGLASFYLNPRTALPTTPGGILGDLLSHGLLLLFNMTGSTLLLMTFLLCGITLVTGLSWLGLIDAIGEKVYKFGCYLSYFIFRKKSFKASIMLQRPLHEEEDRSKQMLQTSLFMQGSPTGIRPTAVSMLEPLRDYDKTYDKKRIDPGSLLKLAPGTLPPLTLLNPPIPLNEKPFAHLSFEELSQLVEQRLADFGVEAKVVAVHPGPVVTRFELELAPGIKVSKISGLSKDIARSLSVVSVRVVEVIPGKSVIGLEIPNENREIVTLRDMLESQRYSQARSPVSLVLGKDISGNPVIVDLAKMPHLLVAGTTGSGKSVSLNAMLLSMLFKSLPEQLRLILIDPKMLELSIYDGIPHLLTPVITDMKDAANALRWCVNEMDKRYRLMASLGVRNLTGYNQKVSDALKHGEPLKKPASLVEDENEDPNLSPLPIIVVIADELADMMMLVGKKVEDLIARIAQKARAAGIHLILATQRPSVDVITGLIKANIPTRIAFQVSSRIDSRTILDQQGAEQLLGHGDMLYLPPGLGMPIRVHGAYVADEEVHRVVAAWRDYGTPHYLMAVTEELAEVSGNGENLTNGEQDPFYAQAVRIVTDSRRASISLVQRRLRIGYNRAARMMEEMEVSGVVSAMDSNGTREVLAPPDSLD